MTSPHLPVPSFLERTPGSDPEIRAWVVTAQEAVAALDAELLAARARAETAEGRLTELSPGASTPGLATGTRTVDEQAELSSRVAETQARFQAATEAAAKVMAEARAVLQEARYGSTPQGPMAPGVPAQPGVTAPGTPTQHSLMAPGAPTPMPTGTPRGSADSSAQAFWAPGPSEPFAPAPPWSPRPPAPAPAPGTPAAASPSEPRAGAANRHIAARPANLGYDPSVVLPPRAPSRPSRPGLGRLFGRSARRP